MRDAKRGFGLVEALVAAVVAAALLVGLLEITGSSAQLQARAAAHVQAQDLARRLLADPALADGRGTTDGQNWVLQLSPSPRDPRGMTPDGFRLMAVSLRIDGPGLGAGYHLTTERVMR